MTATAISLLAAALSGAVATQAAETPAKETAAPVCQSLVAACSASAAAKLGPEELRCAVAASIDGADAVFRGVLKGSMLYGVDKEGRPSEEVSTFHVAKSWKGDLLGQDVEVSHTPMQAGGAPLSYGRSYQILAKKSDNGWVFSPCMFRPFNGNGGVDIDAALNGRKVIRSAPRSAPPTLAKPPRQP